MTNSAPPEQNQTDQQEQAASKGWMEATSVRDALDRWPERIAMLLTALDLTHAGLEDVRTALETDNKAEACAALLEHFENNRSGKRYRETEWNYSLEAADKCMNDILKASGIWGKTPRLSNGGLDWSYEGPADYVNNQWHQINRHPWMRHLLFAGLAGEGDKYLNKLDMFLRDWCAHTERHHQFPVDPEINMGLRVNRKLNAGIRLRASIWPTIFYSFMPNRHFNEATQLLMLAAFVEHGKFLRHHHTPIGNHMMMQIRGLATLADAFPEFAKADSWLRYVQNVAGEEAHRQFYPTGVQKELAQNYHSIVVRDFEELIGIFKRNDLPADEYTREMVYKGTEHLALTMKPNGHGLLFNDANDQSFEWMARKGAENYDTPEWLYICSNGKEGKRPEQGPSIMYPWSGRLISRNGWHAKAQWSAFDIGPWGWGHQHNDKLHLSVFAHGRDLLVDSGRYTYRDYASTDPKSRRGYVRRSWGHNVVLVDNQSQNDDVKMAEYPVVDYRITDEFTYARGTFDKGWYNGREGEHTRAVIYLTDQLWLVFDRLKLTQPNNIQALWHLHPDCTAALQEKDLITTDAGRGNLRLTPLVSDNRKWDTELVRGRTKPTLQGWYSPKQNEILPSPCAVYETHVGEAADFAWLITTGRDTPSPTNTELLPAPEGVMRVKITPDDGPSSTLTAVLDDKNLPVKLPDGRKLFAQSLIETENKPPKVACGWLENQDGQLIAADPMPPETTLKKLAADLEPVEQQAKTRDNVQTWTLPIANVHFRQSLQFNVSPTGDSGNAWKIEVTPQKGTLTTGEKEQVQIRATVSPEKERYPLPQFNIDLRLEDAEKGPIKAEKTVSTRFLGSQPRLPLPKTDKAPEIDGDLDGPAWQLPPDIPVFGRMDRKRDVSPHTSAWLSYDADNLYLAFRCTEPETDNLKLEARQRDDNVWRDDSVEVLLDPTGEGDRYFHVIVNAEGTVQDAEKFDADVDLKGLRVATQVQKGETWTAEVGIPWKDVGLDGPPEDATLLLARNRQAGGEHEVFQFPVSPDGNHQPGFFVRLILLKKK